MKLLQNKTAIVTGAGHPQGIGRAIAQKLAEQGANLVITDLAGAEGLATVAADLRELGGGVLALSCDVTQRAEIDEVIAGAKAEFGTIDALVNNAGVAVGHADFMQLDSDQWDFSVAVNLKGVADFCQAAIPAMKECGGSIINIASLAGLGAMRSIPANYTATKYAVIGLTKSIAAQFAGDQIRCNAVCPGSIVTQMHEQSLELIAREHNVSLAEAQEMENNAVPMGYSAQPGVIGDTVVYLASDQSAYVTGVALPVAGGMAPGL